MIENEPRNAYAHWRTINRVFKGKLFDLKWTKPTRAAKIRLELSHTYNPY